MPVAKPCWHPSHPKDGGETQGVQHSQDIDLFCIPEMDVDDQTKIKDLAGEDSAFHKLNNWAVEPIGQWVMLTSLPEWPERMVKIDTPEGNTGYCISPLDVIFNKAEAGRGKDIRYIKEAIKTGLIKPSQIAQAIQQYGPQLAVGTADRVNNSIQRAVTELAKTKNQNPTIQ